MGDFFFWVFDVSTERERKGKLACWDGQFWKIYGAMVGDVASSLLQEHMPEGGALVKKGSVNISRLKTSPTMHAASERGIA